MNRLKEVRESKGISQSELAEKVGCSRVMISLIETNKTNPTLELCREIANALNVALDDLI